LGKILYANALIIYERRIVADLRINKKYPDQIALEKADNEILGAAYMSDFQKTINNVIEKWEM